jgi:hypothetical protein
MLMTCPVRARRRVVGDLIEVDHQTARALAHLRIAEYEPALPVLSGEVRLVQDFKHAVVTAEPIEKPRGKRKRGYLRVSQ